MPVQKNQRALVVLCEVDNGVPQDFKWLYKFIEGSGRSIVESELADDYIDFQKLYNQDATKDKLLNTLKTFSAKPIIKEIDLIVMLHGNNNRLVFHEGGVNVSALSADIQSLNAGSKLRMVYSTACFGYSHTDEFVSAGFSAAIGAVGVNANAAVEVSVFLKLWSWGWRLRDALAAAETPATRLPADAAARAFGAATDATWKNEVNSDKILRGNGDIKIDSDV
jgi:hypothetical protein